MGNDETFNSLAGIREICPNPPHVSSDLTNYFVGWAPSLQLHDDESIGSRVDAEEVEPADAGDVVLMSRHSSRGLPYLQVPTPVDDGPIPDEELFKLALKNELSLLFGRRLILAILFPAAIGPLVTALPADVVGIEPSQLAIAGFREDWLL